MSLQLEHILNPITALEFYLRPNGPLLILAGEGSFLKTFDAEESKLLSQCEIFDGQAIHGIAVTEAAREDDIQVLIWGGACLTLLKKHDFDEILAKNLTSIAKDALNAPDWILDAKISTFDPGCCILITAHNTVLWTSLSKTSSSVSLETVASPSRSILYSAHLAIEPSGEVLVAAGTVFGEIIVWSCSALGNSQVWFTFTGHEGSIFGVNISPPIRLPDARQSRFLASCSDDRTIRVWDLATTSSINTLRDKKVIVRETGFGQNGDDQTQEAKSSCIATVMAHASRIWRVKFLAGHACPNELPSVNILSFGEDATIQQWGLEMGTDEVFNSMAVASRLSHWKTFAFHDGKHIWSTALHHENAWRAIITTGGADGKVSLVRIEIPSKDHSSSHSYCEKPRSLLKSPDAPEEYVESSSWFLEEDVLSQFDPSHESSRTAAGDPMPEFIEEELSMTEQVDGKPPKKKKAKKVIKDAFNRYAFVSKNQLLLTTTFGRVLLAKIGGEPAWKEVALPKLASLDLKSYSVLQGFPELGLVYLAGVNGKIYAFEGDSRLLEVGTVQGKVADMFKIFNPETKSIELLVTTLAGEIATLFAISGLGTGTLSDRIECKLPEKFVVTSAGRTDDYLILGSRSGSLILFDGKSPVLSLDARENIASTGDAVTSIVPLPSTTGQVGDLNYFLTTSRDGVYSIFTAKASNESDMDIGDTTIRCVHVGSLPFGPMIESAWFHDSDLFLYGFKGRNFIVWNETKQLEIMNVECGGAHRSYAYSPLKTSCGGHFVYTKASKLYIHSQQSPSHTIIKEGGHGREIKACTVSLDGEFIATGAEDTTIRIWRYINKGSILENQFQCQAIMQKHTTGIQNLHWHNSNYLFSSGGNEEFFIWSVEDIPGFGIGVICEATCPDQSEDRDLRIMSLDITDVSVGSMLISLAYSDSTTRTYIYSREGGFELVAKGRYTSSCLTQIRHLEVSDKEAYILTAATDGNITLWKVDLGGREDITDSSSSRLTFLGTQKVHQSTVKCLDFVKYRDSFLVVTGGDDNALGISIYSNSRLTNGFLAPVPRSFMLRSAHAAAITGLCILPSVEDNTSPDVLKIVSSSNDQRVKQWNVQLSHDGVDGLVVVGFQNSSDEFTSIADVGDVAVLRVRSGVDDGLEKQKVLIVGNGMEVWNLPK